MRSQTALLFTFLCYFISQSVFSAVLNDHSLQLEQIYSEICNKNLVLLGEDSHHGSGATIALKVQLVKHLVEECGFAGVFFESPIYEFIHYAESVNIEDTSHIQVSQSIGGLWSRAKTMPSFSLFLHNKAKDGKIKLAGVDAQFGANQPYSQGELAQRLSSYLDKSKAKACKSEIYRYLNWQYNEKTPYNENVKKRLSVCVSEIRDEIDNKTGKISVSDIKVTNDQIIADNFYQYLQFSSGNYFNLRDEQMAKNVLWHINQLPENSKVIVWGATIHMAKTLAPIYTGRVPMAFHLKRIFQDDMFSIGFTALNGKFGRSPDKIKEIKPATMAISAFKNNPYGLRYFNFSELTKLGEIEAQAITYGKTALVNWSQILDALIVIRNEEPIAQ